MLAEEIKEISEEDYLEFERKAESRHEYHNGEIFSMAGASRNHNLILTNIAGELRNQLRRRCRIYVNDMKVRIEETKSYVYPDIIITCGKENFFDKTTDVLVSAEKMVIIEILSDSTEAYDRGAKFYYYRNLPFLKAYLLVSQRDRRIEQFDKIENSKWRFSESDDNEITIEALECKLNLDDVYEDF
ncbi:MAG: Uma2 family endonuclease [Desulfobacterales bacterium]|nr:Uma2 family endonuclease [Desulfobacterales bacterium]MBF0396261.1 Uma2 family endonuclease [Desulfobacterales bacterium]